MCYTQTGSVTDAHALVPGAPVTDECTQDWTLLSADVGSESLVFEAERALDTGDAQDRVFADDSKDGEHWLAEVFFCLLEVYITNVL